MVLGVTISKRVVGAGPDVPTLAERGFELDAWYGVGGVRGHAHVTSSISSGQIAKLTWDLSTLDRLVALSREPLPSSTPDGFTNPIKAEIDRAILKNFGAEIE